MSWRFVLRFKCRDLLSSRAHSLSTRSIGYLAAGGPPDISRQVLSKSATFRGIVIGSRKHAEDLVDFLETANIHPVIDRVFSFEQAKEAYEYMSKATLVGKVVIRVN